MATLNQRHIVHHPDGGWSVQKPNSSRISSRHATQAQAQTRAKEILSHGGGGEAVTHGMGGRIRESETISPAVVDWSLLSPQGHVLFFIALCPDSSTKVIAHAVGRTERQVWNIIQTLKEGGMIHVRKKGRLHQFVINLDAPLLHPTIDGLSLRGLMEGAVEQVHREAPDICETIAL